MTTATKMKPILIVAHPGQAHRDDFLAVCLLLGHYGQMEIQRREVTALDVANPGFILVDVGEDHNPQLLNFDHHQLPATAPPTCALTLVADHLGLLAEAREFSPWFKFSEVLDSKGPKAAQTLAGVHEQGWSMLQPPVEEAMLRLFARDPQALAPIMQEIGRSLIELWATSQERRELLRRQTVVLSMGMESGVTVLVHEIKDQPQLGLENYCLLLHKEESIWVDVTVSPDDRGPGWCLYRRKYNHDGVDFTKIKDDPDVVFAHVNGFIAKTKEIPLTAALQLVGRSIEAGPERKRRQPYTGAA